MLVLAFFFVVYAFLLLGSIAFVLCMLGPRQYGLSVALWFAILGPCLVVSSLILGVGFLAVALGKDHLPIKGQMPALIAGSGWVVTAICIASSLIIASVAARLHQALIRRLTFALFRLYATIVSGGIGSVFGWWLVFDRTWTGLPYGFLYTGFAFTALVAGFGVAAYRYARHLRGSAPERLTWVTPDEYVDPSWL